MIEKGLKIKVLGRTTDDLRIKINAVFDSETHDRSIVLFCDYSEDDIPIDFVFNSIVNAGGDVVYTGRIVLLRVTQQFFTPFDYVPHGWKTICEFVFEDKIIPGIVKELPEINSWDQAKTYLIFD